MSYELERSKSSARHREVMKDLSGGNLLTPYLKNAMLADNWPDEYIIKVDSRPYYGLGDGYFHPSTHGLMDERKLYYMFHPETRDKMHYEERTVTDQFILGMGSALHAVCQTQFQMAGLLRPENTEKEFIIEAHHVRGRADMILDHPTEGELVVEFKTQNSRAFEWQYEMKPQWEMQLSIQLYGLKKKRGVLFVMEAGLPYRMREYHYDRDDDLLARTFAKFDYVRECIERDTPPGHCCSKGSKEMKACPARYSCWLKSEVIA